MTDASQLPLLRHLPLPAKLANLQLPSRLRLSQRERQLAYLSQASRLEEAVNPHAVRLTSMAAAASVVTFVIWAGFTSIHELARAPGEVTPIGQERNLQHLDGGVVSKVLVREGQNVKQGQVLLIVDGAGSTEQLAMLRQRMLRYNLQAERYRAYLEGRQPNFAQFEADPAAVAEQMSMFRAMQSSRSDQRSILADQAQQRRAALGVLEAQSDADQASLNYLREQLDRRKSLAEKGVIASAQVAAAQNDLDRMTAAVRANGEKRRLAQMEVSEAGARGSALGAGQRDEVFAQLNQLDTERLQTLELVKTLEDKVNRLTIRSPVDGIVKNLSGASVGAVVEPGETVASVTPSHERLVVEARLSPRDIGYIKVGQKAQIKLSAYDFTRFGWVTGKLEFISPNTFAAENGERYYKARIRLDQATVGKAGETRPILPGMVASTEIVTGQKTILQYLVKPLRAAMSGALQER